MSREFCTRQRKLNRNYKALGTDACYQCLTVFICG